MLLRKLDIRVHGYCQKWVRLVYAKAGLGNTYYASAFEAYENCVVSDDYTSIPVGAAVYGTGSGTGYGHVGIYIGDGQVMDNSGSGLRTQSLSEWIAWQEERGYVYNGKTGWLGWGWQSGISLDATYEAQDTGVDIESVDSTSNSDSSSSSSSTSSSTITSLDNFLFIGDSVLGTLKSDLESEGATVLYRSGAFTTFFLGEDRSGNTDMNCVLNSSGYFDWDANLGDLSPSGICLVLGHNNVSSSSEDDKIISLVEKLQDEYGDDIPIYIMSVLPCSPNRVSSYVPAADYVAAQQVLNEALQSYCATASNVTYLDVLDGYIDESTGYALADLVGNDSTGVHPNASGVAVIMNNIKSGIIGSSTSRSSSSSSSSSTGNMYAIVATWTQVDTSETSNDPDAPTADPTTTYSMSTTKVYYQNLTSGYTMPFNYLWELLVITENKDFVFDLADLVYNSEFEITVYDNMTVNTEIETTAYVKKTDYSAYAVYTVPGTSKTFRGTATRNEDPTYEIVDTTVTTINTIDVELSKAHTWIVDYDVTSEYNELTETSNNTSVQSLEDEASDYRGDSSVMYELLREAQNNALAQTIFDEEDLEYTDGGVTCHRQYINRSLTNQYIVQRQKYVTSPGTTVEKTDRDSEEPNFVTIFLEYTEAKSYILELDDWLWEIMEANEDTVDYVDLTKYLINKALNSDRYDVGDFDSIWNSIYNNVTNVSTIYGGTVEEKIWWALIDAGYSAESAAGALGNMKYESGGKFATAIETGYNENNGRYRYVPMDK